MVTYLDKENNIISNPEAQITEESARWDVNEELNEKGFVWLCTCGLSSKNPFCDGAHRKKFHPHMTEGGFKPILMEKKDGKVLIKNYRETLLGNTDKLVENRYEKMLERIRMKEAQLQQSETRVLFLLVAAGLGATLGVTLGLGLLKYLKNRVIE